jgi:hypothetical protein
MRLNVCIFTNSPDYHFQKVFMVLYANTPPLFLVAHPSAPSFQSPFLFRCNFVSRNIVTSSSSYVHPLVEQNQLFYYITPFSFRTDYRYALAPFHLYHIILGRISVTRQPRNSRHHCPAFDRKLFSTRMSYQLGLEIEGFRRHVRT